MVSGVLPGVPDHAWYLIKLKFSSEIVGEYGAQCVQSWLIKVLDKFFSQSM